VKIISYSNSRQGQTFWALLELSAIVPWQLGNGFNHWKWNEPVTSVDAANDSINSIMTRRYLLPFTTRRMGISLEPTHKKSLFLSIAGLDSFKWKIFSIPILLTSKTSIISMGNAESVIWWLSLTPRLNANKYSKPLIQCNVITYQPIGLWYPWGKLLHLPLERTKATI